MPNVMELMREYKHLKRLKKEAGMLTESDDARLRELTVYLQGALAGRKAKGSASTAPSPPPPSAAAPRPPPPTPSPPPTAVPVAAPAPAVPVAAPAPAPPGGSDVPLWQRQAEEDAQRQERAQSQFRVDLPQELAEYQPPAGSVSAAGEPQAPPPKKRPRPRSQEELESQLQEVQSGSSYQSSFMPLHAEFYYSQLSEGYDLSAAPADLEPIDPREIELRKAGLLSSTGSPSAGAMTATKVPGGVFLDDFLVLYEKGILPRPEDDQEPEVADPNAIVQGRRKVTVHMLNGEVKRGTIRKTMRGTAGFTLHPQRGQAEEIPFSQVKAVFIQKAPRSPDAPMGGRRVTVEFKDRRRIQGVSVDYQPGAPLFSIVPEGRGNFELVIVNATATARIQ